MVLIHSWGTNDEGFGDFARLVSLMHGEAEIGRAVPAQLSTGKEIWFVWVRGDERWRHYGRDEVVG
jgi:hypothetical protein